MNSIYKSIFVIDKVINKGTWGSQLKSEASFLRQNIAQPKTQPQLTSGPGILRNQLVNKSEKRLLDDRSQK